LAKAGRDLWHDCDAMPAARIFFQLIADFVVYLGLLIRPRKAIAAENLFLLKNRVWHIVICADHFARVMEAKSRFKNSSKSMFPVSHE
jgi:hypothetical protein